MHVHMSDECRPECLARYLSAVSGPVGLRVIRGCLGAPEPACLPVGRLF